MAGILRDGKLVERLNVEETHALLRQGVIRGGMLPKVEAMLHALESGVRATHTIDGNRPEAILTELFTDRGVGTVIKRSHPRNPLH